MLEARAQSLKLSTWGRSLDCPHQYQDRHHSEGSVSILSLRLNLRFYPFPYCFARTEQRIPISLFLPISIPRFTVSSDHRPPSSKLSFILKIKPEHLNCA